MEIKKLADSEKTSAMDLVWRVFQEFEAPEYSSEGVRTFWEYITDPVAVSALTVYGAYDGGRVIGILAIRKNGTHISLFFVDPVLHKKGVGKALFYRFLEDSGAERVTVNSSPYAVAVYHGLGFVPVAPEQVNDGIRYTPMEYVR